MADCNVGNIFPNFEHVFLKWIIRAYFQPLLPLNSNSYANMPGFTATDHIFLRQYASLYCHWTVYSSANMPAFTATDHIFFRQYTSLYCHWTVYSSAYMSAFAATELYIHPPIYQPLLPLNCIFLFQHAILYNHYITYSSASMCVYPAFNVNTQYPPLHRTHVYPLTPLSLARHRNIPPLANHRSIRTSCLRYFLTSHSSWRFERMFQFIA